MQDAKKNVEEEGHTKAQLCPGYFVYYKIRNDNLTKNTATTTAAAAGGGGLQETFV